MDDAELVRSAASGDRDAWGAIYDRYADRLHDYAWTIVRNREDAEDSLQDTFVSAATKIGQLRDPSALRPWLYAICRNAALGRTRSRSREVATDDVPDLMPPAPEQRELDVEEMRTLVWDAAGGLAARDRAILDLHLRQGLDGAELGAALEVSPHNATVMLSRVRDHVDRSLGALLVARTGRGECDELNALLEGWDGTLNPLLRKRVARHIDKCEICGERRRRLVAPSVLLSGVPILPAPFWLRDRILDDAAAAASKAPADGSGRLARMSRSRRRGLWWGAAAASVMVLVGSLLVFGGDDDADSTVTTSPAPTPSGSASDSDSDSPSGSPSASDSPSALASGTSPGTPSVAGPLSTSTTPSPGSSSASSPGSTGSTPSVAPPPVLPPAQPPQPPPQPPPAPPGALSYSGGTLAFGSTGNTLPASFRNTGGSPVSWSISSPVGWVTVSPASGSLPAGATASPTVTLNRATAPEGTLNAALTLSGSPSGPISIPFTATVGRPPIIGSLATNRPWLVFDPGAGCTGATASAQVSDESPPLTVRLFWRQQVPPTVENGMSLRGGTWFGSIGAIAQTPSAGNVVWWVVATDSLGNQTRSADQVVPVQGRPCPT